MNDLIFNSPSTGRNSMAIVRDQKRWIKSGFNAGISVLHHTDILTYPDSDKAREITSSGIGWLGKIKTFDNFFKQQYDDFESNEQLGLLVYKQRTGAKYRQISSLPLNYSFPKNLTYDLQDSEVYSMVFKISLKEKGFVESLRERPKKCVIKPHPVYHGSDNVSIDVLSEKDISISLDELSLRGMRLKKETDQVFEVMIIFQFEDECIISSFVTRQNGQKSKKPIPVSFRLEPDSRVPVLYRIYDNRQLDVDKLKNMYGKELLYCHTNDDNNANSMDDETDEEEESDRRMVKMTPKKKKKKKKKIDVKMIEDDTPFLSPHRHKKYQRRQRSISSKKKVVSMEKNCTSFTTPRRSSRLMKRKKKECKSSFESNRLNIMTTRISDGIRTKKRKMFNNNKNKKMKNDLQNAIFPRNVEENSGHGMTEDYHFSDLAKAIRMNRSNESPSSSSQYSSSSSLNRNNNNNNNSSSRNNILGNHHVFYRVNPPPPPHIPRCDSRYEQQQQQENNYFLNNTLGGRFRGSTDLEEKFAEPLCEGDLSFYFATPHPHPHPPQDNVENHLEDKSDHFLLGLYDGN